MGDFVVYKWHCIKSKKKNLKKKKISGFTDCLCTDLSWWSFAESVHLYWEVDTVWAALSVWPDMLFLNE